MSYTIDCRGSAQFRRNTSGLSVGDVYDLASALGLGFGAATGGVRGAARTAATDRAQNAGSGTSNQQRGMATIANMLGVHQFTRGTDEMSAQKGPTTVNMSCYDRTGLIGASGAMSWQVWHAEQGAGRNLLGAMSGVLEETGLNGGLVLRDMGGMISSYAYHDSSSSTRSILNFVLTKN